MQRRKFDGKDFRQNINQFFIYVTYIQETMNGREFGGETPRVTQS